MNFSLVELAQGILADIFLSGDNAIIIGMAAAGPVSDTHLTLPTPPYV